MHFSNNKKTDKIREMLLKTVGKNPELFSYYVSIQEAKELLGSNNPNNDSVVENSNCKPLRTLTEC